MKEIGRVTPVLLAVLQALLNPSLQRHGFAVARHAGYKPGSVYPVLDRLEAAGWVEARWEPSPFEGRPARRVYSFTAHGESEARQLLAARGLTANKPTSVSQPSVNSQPLGEGTS